MIFSDWIFILIAFFKWNHYSNVLTVKVGFFAFFALMGSFNFLSFWFNKYTAS